MNMIMKQRNVLILTVYKYTGIEFHQNLDMSSLDNYKNNLSYKHCIFKQGRSIINYHIN